MWAIGSATMRMVDEVVMKKLMSARVKVMRAMLMIVPDDSAKTTTVRSARLACGEMLTQKLMHVWKKEPPVWMVQFRVRRVLQ